MITADPLPDSLTLEAPARRGPGAGHLTVDRVAGQSTVTSVWSRSPLQILTPRSRGESVCACLGSLGGGLVAGDDIRLTLTVGQNAKCFVGTQASTKVYCNPAFRTCSQCLDAQVGEEALLVVAPDPVQAFSGSQYCQRQTFHLERESALVLVDWFGSGREACGERWAFNRYRSRNEVFREGECLWVDSLLLCPEHGHLDDRVRLGRFNCLALVLVLGDQFQDSTMRLLEQVAQEPVVKRASLLTTASPVGGGVLLRLAGESTETVASELRRFLAFLPRVLHDDPWARKW